MGNRAQIWKNVFTHLQLCVPAEDGHLTETHAEVFNQGFGAWKYRMHLLQSLRIVQDSEEYN